jgi:hypothetical protein
MSRLYADQEQPMHNYFKPWRRKAGVVALGLALVVTAVWVRCLQGWAFAVDLPEPPIHHVLAAVPRGIAWKTEQETNGATNALKFKHRSGWYTLTRMNWPAAEFLEESRSSYWCGIHNVEGHYPVPAGGSVLERIVLIEYWLIVTPLTLLSAALILWPARRAKPRTPPSQRKPIASDLRSSRSVE